MPLQVVIADDEVLARQKLLQLLREEPDIEVVGEGANALETIDLVQLTQTDVLPLEASSPPKPPCGPSVQFRTNNFAGGQRPGAYLPPSHLFPVTWERSIVAGSMQLGMTRCSKT